MLTRWGSQRLDEVGDMATILRGLRQIWDFMREVIAYKAYERYSNRTCLQGREPLTAREFYLAELQRKYSQPTRCC